MRKWGRVKIRVLSPCIGWNNSVFYWQWFFFFPPARSCARVLSFLSTEICAEYLYMKSSAVLIILYCTKLKKTPNFPVENVKFDI